MDLFKTNKKLKTLSKKDFNGKKIKNIHNEGMLLVYADWCHYCIQLKPTWNSLSKVKGKVQMFIINEADNKELIKELGVVSYPSIFKISKNGSLTPYKGNRDIMSLVNLLCNIDKKNKICSTKK